jgi:hypothetical protein
MSTVISRLYDWVTDKANSVKITASKVDDEMDQVIVGLNRKVLCSGSAPSSPIAGQTWVDTSAKFLKVYRNNEWVIQGIVHVGATAPTTSQEGDLFYDTDDNVLYHYNGSAYVAVATTFTPSAANALAGSVVQVVNTQTGAMATGTTQIPFDDTIPQNTEGDQYMTLAITPTSATNKLKIDVVWIGTTSVNYNDLAVALFQDSTAGSLACAHSNSDASDEFVTICFTHYMTSGTTSATTFKVRAGGDAPGTLTFNGTGGARKFGGVLASSITITEIKV